MDTPFVIPVLLTDLKIKYHPYLYGKGTLYFCDSDGFTFNLLVRENSTILMWLLIPSCRMTDNITKIECAVPEASSSFGWEEVAEDDCVRFFYQCETSGKPYTNDLYNAVKADIQSFMNAARGFTVGSK